MIKSSNRTSRTGSSAAEALVEAALERHGSSAENNCPGSHANDAIAPVNQCHGPNNRTFEVEFPSQAGSVPAVPSIHHRVLDTHYRRFNGLVVMISVLHTEGPEFDPQLNHFYCVPLLLRYHSSKNRRKSGEKAFVYVHLTAPGLRLDIE